MPSFGKKSLEKLGELHPKLQQVLIEAIKHVDFSIYEGHRSSALQQLYFDAGTSKAKPGQSKHNKFPSEAADLWAYPIDWEQTEQQCYIAGVILGIASQMGIKVRWGYDWDRDGDTRDNKFNDMPHFEVLL
jgi:peptidoglycan LD-endopeptidase CwlK